MTLPVNLSGVPTTLMWAYEHDIESQALQQLRNISNLEWVHGLRVMPDVHFGKGATVGSVIAMPNALSPAAVGVDLGCGVNGVKTSLKLEDLPDDLGPLRHRIEEAVPVGFNGHESQVNLKRLGLDRGEKAFWDAFGSLHEGVRDREGRARQQLGTLGGGNHFIELCSDESGSIWITLHSGSRNIGKEIAERHIDGAKNLEHNQGLPDRDLAVFLRGTPEMDAYRADLYWAQDYAARSRATMMALVENVLVDYFAGALASEQTVTFGERISCHHNYVSEEIVDGEEMIVTRKGAISAQEGELGIIPGSMGTGSYVVTGLGNMQSFNSASHGAGRRMSRSKAKKTYTVEDLAIQTHGIEVRKDAGVIDEIPAAYKDIDSVIAAQSDLVSVNARLQTLLCVKG